MTGNYKIPTPVKYGTTVLPPDPFGVGWWYYIWREPRLLPTHYAVRITPAWADKFFRGYDASRKKALEELGLWNTSQ